MGENWDSQRRAGPSLPRVTWEGRAGPSRASGFGRGSLVPIARLPEDLPRVAVSSGSSALSHPGWPGEPPPAPSPDPTAKGSHQVPAQVLCVWISRMLPVA